MDFPFFKRNEFSCKCGCGFDTVDYMLMEELIEIRGEFGEPLIINSASRCVSHNKAVGGGPTSQHLYGKAADFYVKNININILAHYVLNEYSDKYGIGVYSNRIHLDVRDTKARWVVSE
jgi:uncharacterized protein YcbK (DUF882 family)